MDGVDGRCDGAGGAPVAIAEAATDRARAFLGSRRLGELPEEVFRLGEVWILVRALRRRAATPAPPTGSTRCSPASRDAAAASRRPASGRARRPSTSGCWRRRRGARTSPRRISRTRCAPRPRSAPGCRWRAPSSPMRALLLARGAPGDAARAHRLLVDLLASLQLPESGAPASRRPRRRRPPRRRGAGTSSAARATTGPLASPGRLARVRGLRGFEYIVELLRRPHRAVYVVELMSPGGPLAASLDGARGRRARAARGGGGARRVGRSTAAPASTTAPAGASCSPSRPTRERDNDPGRAAGVQREIDMLARELTTGRRGGARGATVGAGAGAGQRAQLRQRRAARRPPPRRAALAAPGEHHQDRHVLRLRARSRRRLGPLI